MGRLLVTGFGPFGAVRPNPSEVLVRRLAGRHAGVECVILPTSYRRATEGLAAAVARLAPAAIVSFGHSASATGFVVERHAHNLDAAAAPDEDGTTGGGPVDIDGPDRLTTTFDVDALVSSLGGAGLRAEASADAGGYVCNHTYYRALCHMGGGAALFVHLSAASADDPLDGVEHIVAWLQRRDQT